MNYIQAQKYEKTENLTNNFTLWRFIPTWGKLLTGPINISLSPGNALYDEKTRRLITILIDLKRPEKDTKFFYIFLSHKDSVLKFLFTNRYSSLTYFPYLY